MRSHLGTAVLLLLASGLTTMASAQGLGSTGTIQGVVKDSTGGVMVAVTVTLTNPASGFESKAITDSAGKYVFRNLSPNPYHVKVAAQGFQTLEKDVDVRTSVPIDLPLTLVPGTATTVEVTATSLVERESTAHTDIDQRVVAKLPIEAASGLNSVIMKLAPGVAADSNGFFHPLGDHAQTQFSIDNQPVADQQSRTYSNQLPPGAVQSMEVITGVAPAEFGDKTSLVVRIVTKSGLGQKPFGAATFGFGWMPGGSCASAGQTSTSNCGSPTGGLEFGFGSHRVGNYLSASGLSTDRYLDPPEQVSINGHGNTGSFFDRFDAQLTDKSAFHLNIVSSRSSFDVPNTYDQDGSGQAQHQTINSFNVAPGYTLMLGTNTLFAANGYVRSDHVTYLPSADPFADSPATVSQDRTLTNYGGKVDVSYLKGRHNLKVGGVISATALKEHTAFGLTDPTLNSPCVDGDGFPSDDTTLTRVEQCAPAGLFVNEAFVPGLLPYDLSRGGSQFIFDDTGAIKQQAAYIEDDIKAGNASFKLGLRLDHYDGLTTATLAEPRLGMSYAVPRTGTVLRASYGRTMETPYNENLLLSSSTGENGFANPDYGAAEVVPLKPGTRDEVELGAQQGFGRWIVVDFSYFDKHTTNAYDFDVLFDTPLAFPISWDKSHIYGVAGRVGLVSYHDVTASFTFGSSNAIFSNPENGGILFNSPLASGDFRIDHDQKFQQTTHLQYLFAKSVGAWAAFSWQYQSGLVSGGPAYFDDYLGLSGDQQAMVGLFCGSVKATPTSPITSCDSANRGATRVVLLADGTADDVTNPPRIAPRHLFDLAIGVDNLFRSERAKVSLRLTVINLANEQVLYNFLSTFSGTHFVTPRALHFEVGIGF